MKHHLDYCEFYITNVCNLNCTDCNRFNNLAFSGHQDWNSCKEKYQVWSQRLSISTISILGGEIFLHPDVCTWLDGIASLWPDANIKFITNGTQMHRIPDLYDRLNRYQGRVRLEINVHNQSEFDDRIKWAHQFLKGKRKTWPEHCWSVGYENIRDVTWPRCDLPEQFHQLPSWIQQECHERGLNLPQPTNIAPSWVDENQIRVNVVPAWRFYSSALRITPDGLQLHNSDPEVAMKACYFKSCHHFIDGYLYKCGPVGLFPDLIHQFPVNINDDDRNLIGSYRPASPYWDDATLEVFLQGLRNADAIPQCKFCPESTVECHDILSSNKKIPIKKLSNQRRVYTEILEDQ